MNIQLFEQLLGEAQVLLLNRNSLTYFGILSYGLEKEVLEEDTFKQKYKELTEDKNADKMSILAFSDGKKITFCGGSIFSRENIIAVICHEVLHIISNHHTMLGNRHLKLWNVACDHVVNRIIKELSDKYSFIKLPQGSIFIEEVHAIYPEISADELYELLLQNNNQPCDEKQNKKDQNCSPNMDIKVESSGEDGEYNLIKVTSQGNTYLGSQDLEATPGSNMNDIEEECKNVISKGKMLWNSPIINKGDIPGSISSYINKLYETHIPWHQVVESAILYQTQSDLQPTWMSRNIYYRHIYLPAYVDGTNTRVLIVCLDSSGSVSDGDLQRFLGVIFGSVNHFKSLIVITHDTKIQDERLLLDNPSQMDIVSNFQTVKGRGGTSHKKVFDRIGELVESEEVSTVLFLTDFESDVKYIYNDYDWVKTIPMIWVLNTKHPVELEGCSTKTIYITKGQTDGIP